MKPHSKHYNRLTGDERFRLCLAAIARGDEAEAAALGDTCPTYQYAARDWSFHRRVDASLQMMVALALELAPPLAMIRELDWQTEHVGDLLDALSLYGFEAAVDAHWQAIDPDGRPETRLQRRLPMPDVDTIMRGPAGSARYTVDALKAAQCRRRDQATQAVAAILAGFDTFAREHWGLTGSDAIAAHSTLFPDLDAAKPAPGAEPPDDEAAERAATRLATLWRSLCPTH